MKKIYQSPVVMIVAMKGNCHLLSGSDPKGTGVMSGNASGEYESLSRRGGSFWDDDDE